MKTRINVELIKSFMEDNKLSKSKFARECNISLGLLNLVLSGDLDFGLRALLKIARYMEVELKDMFIKQ